jgi:FkbM family methyltransferase
MERNLIFDLGLHEGQDTELYLKKGFSVVALDANAGLCAKAAERFQDYVRAGRLTIVNKAIADRSGKVTFYINTSRDDWGTVSSDWVERNNLLGTQSVEREVEATTLADLVSEHGTPYYVKIDIEGYDMVAVSSLEAVRSKPKYLSIESDKVSFPALRREFSVMESLGYDRFRIVDGLSVVKQKLPSPPREGKFVEHTFKEGASGLFGEELPGPWLSAQEAIEAYRPIFLNYALNGDDPLVRSPFIRRVLRKLGFRASWYDTHARRPD